MKTLSLKWCRGAESDCPRLRFQRSALPLSYLGIFKQIYVKNKLTRNNILVNLFIFNTFEFLDVVLGADSGSSAFACGCDYLP
jgi:hypothetical protein